MPIGLGQGVTLRTSSVATTLTNLCGMSFWFRQKKGASSNNLTPLYNGISSSNGWGVGGVATNSLAGLAGGVSWMFTTAVFVPIGVWVHVVFQRNTTWLLYINNVPGSAQNVNPTTPATAVTVGNGSGGSEVIDICDMAIWERLLSSQERLFLASGGSPLSLASGGAGGPKWYVPALGNLGGQRGDLIDVIGGNNLHVFTAGTPQFHDEVPHQIAAHRGAHPTGRMWLPSGAYDPGLGPPANTVAPVASGTPEVGQTLSVTNGTWTNSPTSYTYQWQYNDGTWHDIAGATSSTWVVDVSGAVDVGDSIRCVVTATNGAGSTSANSNSIGPVTSLTLTGHRAMVALG